MTPSYNTVMAWHPEQLTTLAGAVRKLQRGFDAQAPRLSTPVLNLTPAQWKGLSRDAADGRAQQETTWMRSLSDTYGDLATSMEDAAPDIRGTMTALANAKHAADAEGYVLQTGDPGYSVVFDKSKAHGKKFNPQTAHELQQRLKGLGDAADQAVTAASNAVAGGLSAISGMTPASIAQNSATIDPGKASGDARAVLSGTATPEQRARFMKAMQLTPGQLAALNRGEPIDISPEQMMYIRRATGAVDVGNGQVHGIDAFGRFGADDPAVRSALANGLRAVSNENVHSTAGNGGYAMLPQSIKNAQTRPDLVRVSGNFVSMNGVKDNQTIGRLLADGDPKYAAGGEIDKRALEVARQYTDAQAHYEQDAGPYGHPKPGEGSITPGTRTLIVDGQMRFDSSSDVAGGTPASAAGEIQDMLRGSGIDKIAVHDAFTGAHGQDFIHDMLTTRWTDQDAASTPFATGIHDARVDDWGDPNDRFTSKLTGETMRAVTEYTHTHEGWGALKDIPNTNGHSVGQVNPKLLQTLAHSMAPYADDLAGRHDLRMLGFDAEGQLPGHQSLINDPGTHNFEGSSRTYALFGGDPESAKIFYGQAISDIHDAAVHYGHNPNAGDAANDISLIGHLRGLVDEGIAYSSDDAANSAFDAAQQAYETKKSVWESAFKFLDLLPDAPGPTGPLADLYKEGALNSLIGPEPDANNFDPSKYSNFNPSGSGVEDFGAIRSLMAQALPGDLRSQLDPAFVSAHPDWFDGNGHLLSSGQIATIEEHGQPKYGDQEIRDGMGTIIHQIGDTTGNSDDDKLETARDDVTGHSPELGNRWPKK